MRWTARIHRTLDALAVLSEDLVRRSPQPIRLALPEPLSCFGRLPDLPSPPEDTRVWSAPSPGVHDPSDRMIVRVTQSVGERRGTAILVPPWKIRDPGWMKGYVRLLTRSGLDVWFLTPPFHLERTLPGQRSGEGFVSLDLSRLRAAFEQLVLEIRVCVAVAGSRGDVGLVGLSLGALAAALAATAGERLDFVALLAPPMLPLVFAETGIGRRYRRIAASAGGAPIDDGAITSALSPFDPATRAPTTRKIFVASGLYDTIAPPSGPGLLARSWGLAPHVYPRGHLSLLFLCRALRRDLARFVGDPAASPRE